VANEAMPGPVHLCVGGGSTDVPAQVVWAFNGRSARVLQHLREPAQVRNLLTSSYFAASVGEVSESTVRCRVDYQRAEVA
jgi:putative transposase